ncbi:MAG: tetratricopeptide repeat protein [Acidobacteriota bacterium]
MHSVARDSRKAALLLTLSLCAAHSRAAGPSTEAGVRDFLAQHYPAARASLEAALREDASDPRAAEFLGRVFFEENEPQRAVQWLEKACALDPRSAEHSYWLGRALAQQAIRGSMLTRASLAGRIRRAFQRSVDLDPENMEARTGLIEFYLRAPGFMGGSVARAKSEAEEVRRRDALRGHRAMARVYEQQRLWDSAAAEYRKAIAESPSSREPYIWMERSAIDRRDWDGAFRGMDRLLEVFPRDAVPLYEIGRIAAISGRQLDRGEACLRRYLAGPPPKDPEPSVALAHARLAQIAERRGDREAARREAGQALRIDPGILEAREIAARVR